VVPWNKEESEAEGKRPTGRPKLRYKDLCKRDQGAVVQTLDSAIHRIKIYPLDSAIGFTNTYPLDSDLSGG